MRTRKLISQCRRFHRRNSAHRRLKKSRNPLLQRPQRLWLSPNSNPSLPSSRLRVAPQSRSPLRAPSRSPHPTAKTLGARTLVPRVSVRTKSGTALRPHSVQRTRTSHRHRRSLRPPPSPPLRLSSALRLQQGPAQRSGRRPSSDCNRLCFPVLCTVNRHG